MYQPLGQVIPVNGDDHLTKMHGQDSETTVIRELSKGRQINLESKQPELSRATTSTKQPGRRHNKQDKTNRVSKVTQMSTLDEKEEDTVRTDEQMSQLISQASKNHLEEEQDNAVTSKSPRASDTHKDTSGESKGNGNISERVSQSMKLDANLAEKALKTF